MGSAGSPSRRRGGGPWVRQETERGFPLSLHRGRGDPGARAEQAKGSLRQHQAEPLEERPMGLGWRGADAGAVSLGVSAGSRGLGPFGGHD